ncbi:hypothetical protein QA641_36605 [Bradyrhizobium sp. CB1650]|uniref:hypothetical protein n=1 Tax=Bradyrhizobium sp. CB1650 TaxID=3039153 RepID=UPI002435A193|nr:hypothetical protein [Bradyrhizobium sp. CB1650]WGD56907.1 hypothetical protein QA641_36605 [Bradyrhizobium sp. CB1650]
MIPLWTTATFPSYAVGAPATKTGILSASASMLLYGAAVPFGDDCIAAMGIAVRSLAIGALPITGFLWALKLFWVSVVQGRKAHAVDDCRAFGYVFCGRCEFYPTFGQAVQSSVNKLLSD